jgi:hypothetical protein
LHERLADWWCATRDARRGLPDLRAQAVPEVGSGTGPVPASGPWATPRTTFLGQLGRGRAEKEWIHYQAEVSDRLVRLTQATAQCELANAQLRQAQEQLASLAEPGPDALATRVNGEEGTSPSVLAGRRRAEFEQRRQAAQAEVDRIRDAVAGHDLEIAGLRETIRIRFEVARTRAAMIDAYIRRRYAAYLARLARRHPEGKRIGSLIRSDWPSEPPWAGRELPPELFAGTRIAARGPGPAAGGA